MKQFIACDDLEVVCVIIICSSNCNSTGDNHGSKTYCNELNCYYNFCYTNALCDTIGDRHE